MFAVVWAAMVMTAAGAFSSDGPIPIGTFSCNLLSADAYDGTSDNLAVSGLGDITLDGVGGYAQGAVTGNVAWKHNGLHFTTGALSGTIAVVRQDRRGQRYLHIDSTAMNEPAAEPKFGDNICIEK